MNYNHYYETNEIVHCIQTCTWGTQVTTEIDNNDHYKLQLLVSNRKTYNIIVYLYNSPSYTKKTKNIDVK